MSAIESCWDDELAYEVLQRQAAEDLHAGIYDSYMTVMRSLRKHFSDIAPKDDTERMTLELMDQECAEAMRDERPLVPLYTNSLGWEKRAGTPDLSLLEMYRVEPDNGLVVPTSAVTVAYVDRDRPGTVMPTPAFSGQQLHQILEHHVELMDCNLVVRRPR